MPEFLFSDIPGKQLLPILLAFSPFVWFRPVCTVYLASCIGYKNLLTEEYIVSAKLPFIELEMEEDETQLEGITVQASLSGV